MKEYLLQTFRYNDWANQKLCEAIAALPEKDEALKLFSHLINAQDKWYNRITKESSEENFHWFGAVYSEKDILQEWKRSVSKWIALIDSVTEAELSEPVKFKRPSDGKTMRVSLKDLALQLNYHSIHHRAQINTLISKQGIKPPSTDYIFTVLATEE